LTSRQGAHKTTITSGSAFEIFRIGIELGFLHREAGPGTEQEKSSKDVQTESLHLIRYAAAKSIRKKEKEIRSIDGWGLAAKDVLRDWRVGGKVVNSRKSRADSSCGRTKTEIVGAHRDYPPSAEVGYRTGVESGYRGIVKHRAQTITPET
jgi:hypothetical protein